MSNSDNFFRGFILGALIGAGLALLYAPEKGEITRKKLKKKIDEIKKKADEAKSEILTGVEELKKSAEKAKGALKKETKK